MNSKPKGKFHQSLTRPVSSLQNTGTAPNIQEEVDREESDVTETSQQRESDWFQDAKSLERRGTIVTSVPASTSGRMLAERQGSVVHSEMTAITRHQPQQPRFIGSEMGANSLMQQKTLTANQARSVIPIEEEVETFEPSRTFPQKAQGGSILSRRQTVQGTQAQGTRRVEFLLSHDEEDIMRANTFVVERGGQPLVQQTPSRPIAQEETLLQENLEPNQNPEAVASGHSGQANARAQQNQPPEGEGQIYESSNSLVLSPILRQGQDDARSQEEHRPVVEQTESPMRNEVRPRPTRNDPNIEQRRRLEYERQQILIQQVQLQHKLDQVTQTLNQVRGHPDTYESQEFENSLQPHVRALNSPDEVILPSNEVAGTFDNSPPHPQTAEEHTTTSILTEQQLHSGQQTQEVRQRSYTQQRLQHVPMTSRQAPNQLMKSRQIESNILNFQANIMPSTTLPVLKPNQLGRQDSQTSSSHPLGQPARRRRATDNGRDIQALRDKTPGRNIQNNTFTQLFNYEAKTKKPMKIQDRSKSDLEGLNRQPTDRAGRTLEVLDTAGIATKFKLKPGQKLLLQDPAKPDLTILTEDLINQINKTKGSTEGEAKSFLEQPLDLRKKKQSTKQLDNPYHQLSSFFKKPVGDVNIQIQQQIFNQQSGKVEQQKVFVSNAQVINKDKVIPDLGFADRIEKKQTLFKSPILTPITFVSKNPKVDADYYVEPEVDERAGNPNYLEAKRFIQQNYHKMKHPHNPHALQAFSKESFGPQPSSSNGQTPSATTQQRLITNINQLKNHPGQQLLSSFGSSMKVTPQFSNLPQLAQWVQQRNFSKPIADTSDDRKEPKAPPSDMRTSPSLFEAGPLGSVAAPESPSKLINPLSPFALASVGPTDNNSWRGKSFSVVDPSNDSPSTYRRGHSLKKKKTRKKA